MLQRKQDESQLMRRSLMISSFAAAGLLIAVQWHGEMNPLPAAADPIVTNARYRSGSAERYRSGSDARSPKGASAERVARSPQAVQSRLLVDLSDRSVTLFRRGKAIAEYPIAVGQEGWETPTGTFTVEDKHPDPEWEHPITGEVVPAGADNPLGSRWIGFWTDGLNQIGFHGTNQAELIGLAVSHGCIRMMNADIEEMYEQVEMGTTVVVRP